MAEAIRVEILKLRRSRVVLVITVALTVFVPMLCLGMVAVVEGAGAGPLAEKVRGLVSGTGWAAYGGLLDQFVASAHFVGIGVGFTWSFGREFADRTVGSLFSLPVGRRSIAAAKLIVTLVWSIAVSVLVVVVALGAGLAADLGPLDQQAVSSLWGALAVACLTCLLASTLALAASIGKGYLPAIGVLVVVLMTAQLAVLFEAGAWYPFAAPGLWAVGPDTAATRVGPSQLATVLVLAALSALATVRWWGRFQLD